MAFAVQARMVFPVDAPAIEHGVVTIEGDRIAAVGTKPHASDVTDLGDVAVLPGLVNAHTHLEFSQLQRPVGKPGMRLVDWIRLVIAERGRTAMGAHGAIAAGLSECVGHGVTAVGEISSGRLNAYAQTDIEVQSFAEVIGFSRARVDSAYIALIERLESATNARIGISPHAPYTVSPELLKRLIGSAKERGLPVAMHVAESLEELELLSAGTGPFQELLEERSMWDAEAIPSGSRPLDYLRMLAEAPRALVVHGNYLDERECAFLASRAGQMSLVYCPRTHAYFGHHRYPLPELLQAGVHVALGTDSRASNPDLDLLAEMRHVARAHAGIEPQTILKLGTLAGAEALGRAADAGSITPGKLADLVAVPFEDVRAATSDEVLEGVLSGNATPSAVWLRGNRVR